MNTINAAPAACPANSQNECPSVTGPTMPTQQPSAISRMSSSSSDCRARRRSGSVTGRTALVALVALLPSLCAAQLNPAAQREVAGLLEAVGASGCEFMRGGTAYPADQAQQHLRKKYEYMAARGQLVSAEDFVDKAATRSSMLGEAYLMRCGGAVLQPCEQWLRARLKAIRKPPVP